LTPTTGGLVDGSPQFFGASSFAKLKPGPGHSAAEVRANQRSRLEKATAELIVERGYEGLTVRGISKLAGVSTRTFYGHFGNLDECLGLNCTAAMRRAFERMTTSCNACRDWEERAHSGVEFLLRSAARRPGEARMVLIEAADGGPTTRAQLLTVNTAFAGILFDLFPVLDPGSPGSKRLAEGMAAGVVRILRRTLLAERAGELPGLAPELSGWLLAVSRLRAVDHRAPAQGSCLQGARREPDPFPDRRPTNQKAPILDDRATILRAAATLAATAGESALTVAAIRSKTGISKRSFNRYFSDVRECLLEAVEWISTSAATKAEEWAKSTPRGSRRAQQLFLALGAQAARSQPLARVVFLTPQCGRKGLLCEDRLLRLAASRLGTDILAAPQRGERIATEASTAAVWRIASEEVAAGRTRRLPRLAPALAEFACAPARSSARCRRLPVDATGHPEAPS
jgi:AcrR family transcriptional regulator